MKQPKINGRQARWLVYLTPYDFIIKHRPGILNPADGPSRRPDYKAQKEPSQIQLDLLANRLVESSSDLPEAELYRTANLRPYETANNLPEAELCDIARAT